MLACVLCLFAARCLYVWTQAVHELPRLAQTSAAEHMDPGLLATVDWLRAHTRGAVRGAQGGRLDVLHQRLAELLYPRPFMLAPASELVAGELVVCGSADQLALAHRRIFEAGELCVVQVER